MTKIEKTIDAYQGLEQGPIRPPAEANSLLLRITRNCPWNHCTFCPVYKGQKFSKRPLEHIIQDIDSVHRFISEINDIAKKSPETAQTQINSMGSRISPMENQAFNAAIHWFSGGMESIFLQDADSLILRPSDMIEILKYIKKRFPWVKRITSFARTHTLVNISDDNLKKFSDCGLNRVHAGLETGSDRILKLVKKGCTKEMHIKAGLKVKKAGIELSECILCGVGGKNLYTEHAVETADTINYINPHIIRFLTLGVPKNAEIFVNSEVDRFNRSTDLDIAKEIKLFIENLDGITTYIESNNILNLLQEVNGTMPQDKQKIIDVLNRFIHMPPDKRVLFQVGKRLQVFSVMDDLQDNKRIEMAKQTCSQYGITPDNADDIIAEIIQSYMS